MDLRRNQLFWYSIKNLMDNRKSVPFETVNKSPSFFHPDENSLSDDFSKEQEKIFLINTITYLILFNITSYGVYVRLSFFPFHSEIYFMHRFPKFK